MFFLFFLWNFVWADSGQWTIGVTNLYVEYPYRGRSARWLVLPNLEYEKRNLKINAVKAEYKLFSHASFFMMPHFFSGGYEAKDSSFLKGMAERRPGVDFGVQSQVKLKPLSLQLRYRREMWGVHGGVVGSVSLATALPLSVFLKSKTFMLLRLGYGLKYYDQRYSDHFYGVKVSEATPRRPAYAPKGGFSRFLRSFLMVQIAPQWSLVALYRREWLSEEIEKSPLVGRKKVSQGFIGLSYQF